jgi:hypothetical protein
MFDATILGGIMVMPVVGAVAMASIFLAALAPLRPLEGEVFVIAGLWFVAAVVGAHLRVRRDNADRVQ